MKTWWWRSSLFAHYWFAQEGRRVEEAVCTARLGGRGGQKQDLESMCLSPSLAPGLEGGVGRVEILQKRNWTQGTKVGSLRDRESCRAALRPQWQGTAHNGDMDRVGTEAFSLCAHGTQTARFGCPQAAAGGRGGTLRIYTLAEGPVPMGTGSSGHALGQWGHTEEDSWWACVRTTRGIPEVTGGDLRWWWWWRGWGPHCARRCSEPVNVTCCSVRPCVYPSVGDPFPERTFGVSPMFRERMWTRRFFPGPSRAKEQAEWRKQRGWKLGWPWKGEVLHVSSPPAFRGFITQMTSEGSKTDGTEGSTPTGIR